MGFPASQGAPFLPYAILDSIVAPHSSYAASTVAPPADHTVDVDMENPLVSEPRVLKEEFSEAVVRLPHSYFGNSYRDAYPLHTFEAASGDMLNPGDAPAGGKPSHEWVQQPPTRAGEGLPEEGVVYACFNQIYKLDPTILSTW